MQEPGNAGLIPGLGTSPGEGNGNPLQCSCLENSMNREAWRAYSTWGRTSRTRLYEFHFHFQKKDWERKKKSPANSHICGSEGQLLFDTVLISGEDQIFWYSCIDFLLSYSIKRQSWKSILYIYEN